MFCGWNINDDGEAPLVFNLASLSIWQWFLAESPKPVRHPDRTWMRKNEMTNKKQLWGMSQCWIRLRNNLPAHTRRMVPRSLAPIKKDHLRPKSTVYTSTNNHLGWELEGSWVLGVGTGDRGLIHGDALQWTNNHLGWELGRTGVLGVGTGDRGLRLGDVLHN